MYGAPFSLRSPSALPTLINSLGTPAFPGQGDMTLHPEHSWLQGTQRVAIPTWVHAGHPGVRSSEEEESGSVPSGSEVHLWLPPQRSGLPSLGPEVQPPCPGL